MSSGWEAQVDAMADTIEEMVLSGKGEVSEYRGTANETIMSVGRALPENVRNALQNRLNSRLDALEAKINSHIDHAASAASEITQNTLDDAMMNFIQTMKGLPTDELVQLFSFIDKDKDGTINQEEFGQFVSTTLPPGTVIPPSAIALGFQVLDQDNSGTLSVSDIIGTEGDVISKATEIVSEQLHDDSSVEAQDTVTQDVEMGTEIISEQLYDDSSVEAQDTVTQDVEMESEIVNQIEKPEGENEEKLDSSTNTMDSKAIESKLSEARFSSEKRKIINEITGNLVEFDVSINRVRTEGSQSKPMEVEVSTDDSTEYLLSIDLSKVNQIPKTIENRKGKLHIQGSVIGFNMARNCVVIDVSKMN